MILCAGNFARGQMAEGLLKSIGAGEYKVESAGVASSRVRLEAIQAMREIGIDISENRSKSVDEFAGQNFEYVIAVCDNANEIRPGFSAARSEFIGVALIRRLKASAMSNRRRRYFGQCVMN